MNHETVLDKPRTPEEKEAAARRDAPPAPVSAPAPPIDTPVLTGHVALFGERDAGELRRRWNEVQAGFVDEPRRSVEHADALVADVLKRLTDTFTNERTSLERQWDGGDSVTTEDLRVTLQRYRSFFDRLLTI
jgi:hypothetical protein